MNIDRLGGLTSGYLPVAAFAHLEPTAVGVVDLERSPQPASPDAGAGSTDHRDGLLLVRLHGDPLAVVHVDGDPARLSDEQLAEQIWLGASSEICGHVERFRCMKMPGGADALLDEAHRADSCPGDRPPDVDLSVAVIVSTAGRDQQLARCIRSLLAQRHEHLEVIVVDNRPDSEDARRAVEPIVAVDRRVRYVAEPRAGLSVARNRGVSETSAQIVAFTDDDVVVDDAWLEWLLAPFAKREVLVCCGMVLPLELETEAQKRFEQYAGFSKGIQRHVYDIKDGPVAGRLLYPYINGVIGTGNNMAFRRAELVAAGGFDPALGAGSPAGSCEETCAFGRAILTGGIIVYEPRALCWHEHRKDGGALYQQIFGYGTGLGAVITKALITDPRFYISAARSLGIALKIQWRQHRSNTQPNNSAAMSRPNELLRARRQGIVRGPFRYAAGVRRSRRLGLNSVIRGG
jgi:O-antigen biosynthesis protein